MVGSSWQAVHSPDVPINLIDVAGGTFKNGVLPFQRPDLGMIEIGHFAGAIMAGQTIGTELGGMVNDELRFGFSVALCALGAGKRELVSWLTWQVRQVNGCYRNWWYG